MARGSLLPCAISSHSPYEELSTLLYKQCIVYPFLRVLVQLLYSATCIDKIKTSIYHHNGMYHNTQIQAYALRMGLLSGSSLG